MRTSTFTASNDHDAADARAARNTAGLAIEASARGEDDFAEWLGMVLVDMVGEAKARKMLGKVAKEIL